MKVFSLGDNDLHLALRAAKPVMKLVLLRDLDHHQQQQQPSAQKPAATDTTEHVQNMREDLSLAMLELETVNQENKDLSTDLDQ